MKVASQRLALAAALFASCLAAAQQNKGSGSTYRWVDEKGVVHYGDHVPPEYARQERAVLNKQGVVVEKLEAEKTPEELAADARRREEVQRRHQHDTFLLTTYVSVKDIESLRDERLAQLQGQVRAAEIYLGNLDERLQSLRTRAQMFRPYNSNEAARKMPDALAEDLVRTLNEIRTQRRHLEAKRSEQTTLRARFQTDIDRYRELKSSRTSMR
jgi:hypothetical protein